MRHRALPLSTLLAILVFVGFSTEVHAQTGRVHGGLLSQNGLLPQTGLARTVLAQAGGDRTGARAAAEQGARAFDAGRYAEAIDYFQRAEKLYHATPHLLYMARAGIKLGQLVEAREHLLAIINEPLSPQANQVLKDTRAMAERELDQLEPRIPRVSIVVQGENAEGTKVWLDDRELPGVLLGIPQPINPGKHRFQAKAIGMESSVSVLDLREGAKETVVLTLQAGGGLARPEPEPGVGGTAQPLEPTADSGVGDSGGANWYQIGGYTGIGIGAVGAALGTVFLIQGNDVANDADALFESCPRGTTGRPACDPAVSAEVQSLDNSAADKLTLSVVSYAVGGAGLATGIVLLLLDPSDSEKAENEPAWRPWVGFGSAGLSGTF